jgi:hypothetical protein
MSSHRAEHSAKHAATSRKVTREVGRLPHGIGGILGRAVRGAMRASGGRIGEPARGMIQAGNRAGPGRGLHETPPDDLTGPAAQQLKILQDIYNLMSGAGINVIVKNADLQSRFG